MTASSTSSAPTCSSHSWGSFYARCAITSTPLEEARGRLLVLLGKLKSPELKQFLARVLTAEGLLPLFFTCPGSIIYHHNYPGGLLEHSVAVAERVCSEPSWSQQERDVGLVAGLLHDIGKTRMFTPNMRFTKSARAVKHESLTLELCAQALAELDASNAPMANLLRHCWTCRLNAAHGLPVRSRIARSVIAHDGVSAFNSNETEAFKTAPPHHCFASRGKGAAAAQYIRLPLAC